MHPASFFKHMRSSLHRTALTDYRILGNVFNVHILGGRAAPQTSQRRIHACSECAFELITKTHGFAPISNEWRVLELLMWPTPMKRLNNDIYKKPAALAPLKQHLICVWVSFYRIRRSHSDSDSLSTGITMLIFFFRLGFVKHNNVQIWPWFNKKYEAVGFFFLPARPSAAARRGLAKVPYLETMALQQFLQAPLNIPACPMYTGNDSSP